MLAFGAGTVRIRASTVRTYAQFADAGIFYFASTFLFGQHFFWLAHMLEHEKSAQKLVNMCESSTVCAKRNGDDLGEIHI
jgi:hypothetical protein